ncbi:hypothetical protein HK096_009492 [Nowakowskiella sp. JEL0078]|nr:hypothetical protein HK096_009492 [Nowakowskiella sp. JEL0078]
MQVEKGYAFVKLDTHEHAALAIFSLNGKSINGRTIKCHWGKDRSDGHLQQIQPQQQNQYPGYPYQPQIPMPTYGYFPGMSMTPQFAPQVAADGRSDQEVSSQGKLGYLPQGQQPQQWPYYFPQQNQPQGV